MKAGVSERNENTCFKEKTWKLVAQREKICCTKEEKEQTHSIWLVLLSNTRCCSALVLQFAV